MTRVQSGEPCLSAIDNHSPGFAQRLRLLLQLESSGGSRASKVAALVADGRGDQD